jgi:hypothetical protein
MIRRGSFVFAGFQGVAFFENMQFSPLRIATAVQEAFPDILDGDPIMMPTEGAPPTVPKLILQSKAQDYRFEAAPSRIDLRLQRRNAEQQLGLNTFCELAVRAISVFSAAANARPGRLALISVRFQKAADSGRQLAEYFCKPEMLVQEPARKGPLNRPEAFELHAQKAYELDGFQVNSWVRCKAATVVTGEDAILIEQDINTRAELTAESAFTDEQIESFFRTVSAEMDSILRVYFPAE